MYFYFSLLCLEMHDTKWYQYLLYNIPLQSKKNNEICYISFVRNYAKPTKLGNITKHEAI